MRTAEFGEKFFFCFAALTKNGKDEPVVVEFVKEPNL
jgi:hypothetical protein